MIMMGEDRDKFGFFSLWDGNMTKTMLGCLYICDNVTDTDGCQGPGATRLFRRV